MGSGLCSGPGIYRMPITLAEEEAIAAAGRKAVVPDGAKRSSVVPVLDSPPNPCRHLSPTAHLYQNQLPPTSSNDADEKVMAELREVPRFPLRGDALVMQGFLERLYGMRGWGQDSSLHRVSAETATANPMFGELLPKGVEHLCNPTHLNVAKASNFYDLGAGYGRMMMQVFWSFPNVKLVVGVELCRDRYEIGAKAILHLCDLVPSCLKITGRYQNSLIVHMVQDPTTRKELVPPRVLEWHNADLFTFTQRIHTADIVCCLAALPATATDPFLSLVASLTSGARFAFTPRYQNLPAPAFKETTAGFQFWRHPQTHQSNQNTSAPTPVPTLAQAIAAAPTPSAASFAERPRTTMIYPHRRFGDQPPCACTRKCDSVASGVRRCVLVNLDLPTTTSSVFDPMAESWAAAPELVRELTNVESVCRRYECSWSPTGTDCVRIGQVQKPSNASPAKP